MGGAAWVGHISCLVQVSSLERLGTDWVLHIVNGEVHKEEYSCLLSCVIFLLPLERGGDFVTRELLRIADQAAVVLFWGLEAGIQIGGGVESEVIGGPGPFLSLGNDSVLEISRRGSAAAERWWLPEKGSRQSSSQDSPWELGEGHFVCLLFLPNPAFHFHSKITSPQRHSFCVLRNLKTCCKTWTY